MRTWSSCYREESSIQGDGADICLFAHGHINTPQQRKKEREQKRQKYRCQSLISNTSVLKRLELHSKQEKWKTMKNLPLDFSTIYHTINASFPDTLILHLAAFTK